jgi:hypothetical protein
MALLLCLWAGMAGSEEKSRIDSQQIKSHQQALPQTANSKTVVNKYVLAMSKNDDVCGHMLRIFNDDLQKYGDIRFNKHNEFNILRWEKKPRYRINEKSNNIEVIGTDLYSLFDINNDRRKEIVLWSRDSGLKGIPSDKIFVFSTKYKSDFSKGVEHTISQYSKASVILGGAFDREPFRGNTYALKELPPIEILPQLGEKKNVEIYHSLGGWFYFNPFLYEGTYYVTMTDWHPGQEEKWLVILKLNAENHIEDICYYRGITETATKR